MATQVDDELEKYAKPSAAKSSDDDELERYAKKSSASSSGDYESDYVPPPVKPHQPGYLERLGQSVGVPTSIGELGKALTPESVKLLQTPKNAEEAKDYMRSAASVATGGAYPLLEGAYNWGKKAIGKIGEGMGEEYQAAKNIGAGQPVLPNIGKAAYGVVHGGVGSIPFIGDPIETAGEDVLNKNYAGAAGGLTGVIGQVAAPELLEKVGAPALKKFNTARTGLAEKMVGPLTYEGVGEAGADRRMGVNPESGIVKEGHVGTKEMLLEQAKQRTAELKNAADNILQNHPRANTPINVEPFIDQAIDEAILKSEKVAGSTERLENLRTALKTKYGPTTGTPLEMNNLKTDIQRAANDLGAYKNTQPVEASAAAAMKNVAKLIKDEVNHHIPEAAKLNERMSNSIDAQSGLQRQIDAARGESLFGGFHEGTTSRLLNRTLGSAPVRSGVARILNIGNVEGVPRPLPPLPPVAPIPPVPIRGALPAPPTPVGYTYGTGPINTPPPQPAHTVVPVPGGRFVRGLIPGPIAPEAPVAPPAVPGPFRIEPIGSPTDAGRIGMRGEQGTRTPAPKGLLPEIATAVPAPKIPFTGPLEPNAPTKPIMEGAPPIEIPTGQLPLKPEAERAAAMKEIKPPSAKGKIKPVAERLSTEEIAEAEGLLASEAGAMATGDRPGAYFDESEQGDVRLGSRGAQTRGGDWRGVKSGRRMYPFMRENPDVNPQAVLKALRNKDSAAYNKLITRADDFIKGNYEKPPGMGAMDFIKALENPDAEPETIEPGADVFAPPEQEAAPEPTPGRIPQIGKGQTGVIPGMEEDVAKQNQGAAKVAGEKLTAEANRPKDISAAAGEMETKSPLFRGTEASPQREIFGGAPPAANEPPATIVPVLKETGWQFEGKNNLGQYTIRMPGTEVRIHLFERELNPDFIKRQILAKEKQFGTPKPKGDKGAVNF